MYIISFQLLLNIFKTTLAASQLRSELHCNVKTFYTFYLELDPALEVTLVLADLLLFNVRFQIKLKKI